MKKLRNPMDRNMRLTLFFTLVLLWVAYLLWGWSHDINNLGGDSAGYLLAAKYFSPYSERLPYVSSYGEFIFYPPLFPVILASFGAGESILIGHLVVVTFVPMISAMMFFWMRSEKISWQKSLVAAVVFALMPGVYMQSLNIWSENLYILLSLIAIFAVTKAGQNNEEKVWYWVAACVIALSTLTRVAAAPLLAAFLLYIFIKKPERYLLIGGVATVPFATWMALKAIFTAGGSPYLFHWVDMYSPGILSVLLTQIYTETVALGGAWKAAWMHFSPSPLAGALVGLLAIACIGGWLYRLKLLKFDAIYVAIYFIVLFLWPHPEEAMRYSSVLYPILIVNGLYLSRKLLPDRIMMANKPAMPIILLFLMTAAVLPALATNFAYFIQDIPDELSQGRRNANWYGNDRLMAAYRTKHNIALLEHMRAIKGSVNVNDCIFSIKPRIVSLYTERTAIPTPKSNVSDDVFNEEISRCRYAYLLSSASPSYREPFYPASRLGDRARLVSEKLLFDDNPNSVIGILIEIGEK